MMENLNLLTLVSNNNDNFAVYISLVVIAWVLASCCLFAFACLMLRILIVKYTTRTRWWGLSIAFVLFGAVIAASVLLKFYGIEPEIWSALTVVGGLGIAYWITFLVIKIRNCVKAKKRHMSERSWCDIQWAKFMGKKIVAKITVSGILRHLSRLDPKQKREFLSRLFRSYKILKRVGTQFNVCKEDLINGLKNLVNAIKSRRGMNINDQEQESEDAQQEDVVDEPQPVEVPKEVVKTKANVTKKPKTKTKKSKKKSKK